MAIIDYNITYMHTQTTDMFITAWSIMNDIIDSGYKNDLIIEYFHIVLVAMLGIYMLRSFILYCRKPTNYQILLQKITNIEENQATSLVKRTLFRIRTVEENQDTIINRLSDIQGCQSALDRKVCQIYKIVDQPYTVEDIQTTILNRLSDIQDFQSALDRKVGKIYKIVDQPFKFQHSSQDNNILKLKSPKLKKRRTRYPRAVKLRAEYKRLYGTDIE